MALPDRVTQVAATTRATGITGASLISGSNYLGAEIDNTVNQDDLLSLQIVYSFATAPTANKTARLWLLFSFDGTNYEEGDGNGTSSGNVNPLATSFLVRCWSPPADTGTHRINVFDIQIPWKKMKLLVQNVDTGQTMTVTVNAETAKAAQIIE